MGVEANDAECMAWFDGSLEEKFTLYERAAALSHPRAAFMAGYYSEHALGCPGDWGKAARYYQLAARLGYKPRNFTLDDELERLKGLDSRSVVPYGEWAPESHRWVTHSIHSEMKTILLMHARRGTLFGALPRDVILHHILPYICTKPFLGKLTIEEASFESSASSSEDCSSCS